MDPTASSGQVGRAWAAVQWTVSAADCVVANCTVIAQYLNSYYPDTNAFVTIPNKYFKPTDQVGSYIFTLQVTNYFQRSSTGSVSVQLSQGRAGPLVSISSPLIITQYRWQFTTLSATVSQPSCNPNATQPLSFCWSVYQGLTYLPLLTSASSDPRTFLLPPYSLDIGTAYTIKVTAAFGESNCSHKV